MTNPTLNIEVKAQIDDALRGFNAFKDVNKDAAGALGVFGVSLSSLNSPLTAIASGIKDSIDTTTRWANTIDKLSRATGESAEETSQMAVVFEDFGIQADSLDKVIKQFTKNGLQFNMETIRKLAKEYQAIQDPVARDEFAFKNFGRSGLELTEILSKTDDELTAVGNAARYSGKVMSEQGVEAAQQFGVKVAQLQDRLDGLKIAIGGPVIDTLSRAIDGFHSFERTIGAVDIAIMAHTGLITWDEAAARTEAVAQGGVAEAFRSQATAIAQSIDPLSESGKLAQQNTRYWTNYSYATGDLARAAEGAKVSFYDLAEAAKASNQELSNLNTAIQGPIKQANDAYYKQQKDLGAQITETKNEIEKLRKSQGAFIPSTINAAEVTDNLTIAQYNAEKSSAALAEAQKKLNENTDPEKTLELQAAVAKANQSYGEAVGAVGEWNAKLDEAGQVHIVDHQKKIGELEGTLGELNAAYDANAKQHEAATARIVFGFLQQELAADGFTKAEIKFLVDIGTQWGIYDVETKRVLDAVTTSIEQHGLDAGAVLDDLSNKITGLPDRTVNINVVTTYTTVGSEDFGGAGNNPPSTTTGGIEDIAQHQFGGPTYAGTTYLVGERGPELFVPPQSGYMMDNADTMRLIRALEQGQGAGGPSIYVDARGALDPAAVEDAGYRGAQRALAEAGYRGDARLRMGAY